MVPEAIDVRPAVPEDEPEILVLAAAALGWRKPARDEALYRWKHRSGPFGASPAWVAEADGRLVGFRTFLRWRFADRDGTTVDAVRAVDTATHPDAQGRGVFRTLTLHGIDALTEAGVGFVFNTPNDKSRPGYLKMGWEQLGRVPVAARPTSLAGLRRLLRARTAASKWSEPSAVGDGPADVLADERGVAALLASQPAPQGLRTERSPAFLAWRYAAGPVAYRTLLRTTRVEDGLVVFRVRRRGPAAEVAVADLLVPDADPRLEADLLDRLVRAAGGDYLLRVQAEPLRQRAVRVPVGPILTWRGLARRANPGLAGFDLRLGDIELF